MKSIFLIPIVILAISFISWKFESYFLTLYLKKRDFCNCLGIGFVFNYNTLRYMYIYFKLIINLCIYIEWKQGDWIPQQEGKEISYYG